MRIETSLPPCTIKKRADSITDPCCLGILGSHHIGGDAGCCDRLYRSFVGKPVCALKLECLKLYALEQVKQCNSLMIMATRTGLEQV